MNYFVMISGPTGLPIPLCDGDGQIDLFEDELEAEDAADNLGHHEYEVYEWVY